MCSRPSTSVKQTVTALIRFSSVRYLRRSSSTCASGVCLVRFSLASRFISSSLGCVCVLFLFCLWFVLPPRVLGVGFFEKVAQGVMTHRQLLFLGLSR